jgi:hypothetical protein
MSSSLDQLETRITTAFGGLPTGWTLVNLDSDNGAKRYGTVLFYEITDVHTELSGLKLPRGILGVDVALTLQVAGTDLEKSGRAAISAALDLIPILDSMDDLYWSDMEKAVRTTGETFYRISVTFIATYPSPEEE